MLKREWGHNVAKAEAQSYAKPLALCMWASGCLRRFQSRDLVWSQICNRLIPLGGLHVDALGGAACPLLAAAHASLTDSMLVDLLKRIEAVGSYAEKNGAG